MFTTLNFLQEKQITNKMNYKKTIREAFPITKYDLLPIY